MSALACEPGKGSELEVGFRAMLAAARLHEVWVLTNKDTVPRCFGGLRAGRKRSGSISKESISGSMREGIALLTIPGFHLYYDRWQRRAASRARRARPSSGFRRRASCDSGGLLDAHRRGRAGQAAGLGTGWRRSGDSPAAAARIGLAWFARRRRPGCDPSPARPFRPRASGTTPSGRHVRAERVPRSRRFAPPAAFR